MSRTQLAPALLVAGAVVLVDQVVKLGAFRSSGAVAAARNDAYAFGVVGGPAPALVVGSVLVLVVFVAVIGRWAVQIGLPATLPALVAGGMAANTLDRIQMGAVRDVLVTPWAIVNIADVAVAAGIAALAVAFVVRVRHLRLASCTVALDRATLRAVVVGRPGRV